jgi:hypothetical protein
MSALFLACLLSFAHANDGVVVAGAGMTEDDDDFFSTGGSTTEKGANAGVPDTDVFGEENSLDIPITLTEEELAAEAKLKAAMEAERAAAARKSTAMPVDTSNATPLADNWAPTVVVSDRDAVVVDMPVLYALTKQDFEGSAYWLVAEVYVDGKKVAEGRASVTREAVADKGPSVQFFRLFAPVVGASGVLEVKVSRAPQSGKATLLFTRSVAYKTTS